MIECEFVDALYFYLLNTDNFGLREHSYHGS